MPVRSPNSAGGIFCPSCGSHHKAGTLCGNKSIDDVLDVLKSVTMSGNKSGNPAHDSETGQFASKNAVAKQEAGGTGPGSAIMKQPGILEQMAGPDMGKLTDTEYAGKKAKGRAMQEAGRKKNAQREADSRTAADKKQYQNEVHFVIGGNNSDKPSFAQWKAKRDAAVGPNAGPDLANMPQPNANPLGDKVDPKAKTEMAPKQKKPVEYFNPDKPLGNTPAPSAKAKLAETDDFISAGEDQPKARPEANTQSNWQETPQSLEAKQARESKKKELLAQGVSEQDADRQSLSHGVSQLRDKVVKEKENKIATKNTIQGTPDSLPLPPDTKMMNRLSPPPSQTSGTSVGKMKKPNAQPPAITSHGLPMAPSTGIGPVDQTNMGMRPPVAPPIAPGVLPADPSIPDPSMPSAPIPDPSMQPGVSAPANTAPGNVGNPAVGTGSTGTSGANTQMGGNSGAMGTMPQQKPMNIPLSQMYSAGQSMGSSLGTPGGVAAPTVSFGAQRMHTLLNPNINSAAGPALAMQGTPRGSISPQMKKSFMNLQNWIDNYGK